MFPSASSQQRISSNSEKKSKKVPLRPGRSLVDWIRLTKSGKDLKGTGPRLLRIPEEELIKHNKENDLWIALRGLVYNVTSYIEYHPGGASELMRGAGKDATALFDEVHRWVNYESMLKECLIGKLVTSIEKPLSKSMLAPTQPTTSHLNPLGVNTMQLNPGGLKIPNVPTIKVDNVELPSLDSNNSFIRPSHDWYQSGKYVTLVIYCKDLSLDKGDILCDVMGETLFVDIKISSKMHRFEIELCRPVIPGLNLSVTSLGNAQIMLEKVDLSYQWPTLGFLKYSPSDFYRQDFSKMRFIECKIIDKIPLTHDTALYAVNIPGSRIMKVPIGYHVYVKVLIEGHEVSRPYTPVLKSLMTSEDTSVPGEVLYFAIKHYSDGVVTGILKTKVPGDKVLVSNYDGDFNQKKCSNFKVYVMLAAGTGITPMHKLIPSVLHDKVQKDLHLLFFNKSQDDIIWQKEFEYLKEKHDARFHVEHVLSQPSDSWNGRCGRISHELLESYIKENLPSASKADLFFLICGPKMFSDLASDIIANMGYRSVHVFT